MVHRQIRTDIWEKMEDWSPEERLVFIYLISCGQTTICGFYRISASSIQIHTGLTREAVTGALRSLEDVRSQVIYDNQLVYLPDYAEHQGAYDYEKSSGLGYFHDHVLKIAAEHAKKGNRAYDAFAQKNSHLLSSTPARKESKQIARKKGGQKRTVHTAAEGIGKPLDEPLSKPLAKDIDKALENPSTRVNNYNYINNNDLSASRGEVESTPREEIKPDRPDSLATVEMFFIGMRLEDPKEQAAQFFDHYEANGWCQAPGKIIRNWQAAARNWVRRAPGFKPVNTRQLSDNLNGTPPKPKNHESAAEVLAKGHVNLDALDSIKRSLEKFKPRPKATVATATTEEVAP